MRVTLDSKSDEVTTLNKIVTILQNSFSALYRYSFTGFLLLASRTKVLVVGSLTFPTNWIVLYLQQRLTTDGLHGASGKHVAPRVATEPSCPVEGAQTTEVEKTVSKCTVNK